MTGRQHPPDFSLVIFDCDGVLVDSEMLSASVLMAMMAELELPITPEIFRSDFLGRSFAAAAARAEARFGRKLPSAFQHNYRDRLFAELSKNLHLMDGVKPVIEALSIPFCLATSSSPQRLALTLEVTGLTAIFKDISFTASEVQHGKPAPDLCLHAANKMHVEPNSCLVIDDSEMGVRAAQAAGMTVWHFAGGAHVRAGYRLPDDVVPDRVIANMPDLLRTFAGHGLC